jgi:hypothetical protein
MRALWICSLLGAGVGGLVGWRLGDGAKYFEWVTGLLLLYVFGFGFFVIAIAHKRGVLWGLGTAVVRIGWFIAGLTVILLILTIVAMPFALILSTPVAEKVQQWSPTSSGIAIKAAFSALGGAVLVAIGKIRIGTALLFFSLQGLYKGAVLGSLDYVRNYLPAHILGHIPDSHIVRRLAGWMGWTSSRRSFRGRRRFCPWLLFDTIGHRVGGY